MASEPVQHLKQSWLTYLRIFSIEYFEYEAIALVKKFYNLDLEAVLRRGLADA